MLPDLSKTFFFLPEITGDLISVPLSNTDTLPNQWGGGSEGTPMFHD